MYYTVSPELYQETATRLCDAIDQQNYYAGTLDFDFEGMTCQLRTSVIVYRRTNSCPEGTTEPITDLVPVWWEFHTLDAAGEQLNDFDFSELKSTVV